ncbi:hypothetical protein DICPUDRAFT_87063 [Dictyostelium purpureum]|uniref:CAP-Gly domain-containing protein n=1 Tax=Dictyostelium purpureum TaxID=5786 RepID=F0ZFR0_DICPU|nr:uncharacterized protein DICPUDRAFT_87063 [Dictyostelium purpureum]EGC37199.1 hypothetical protein DICPUDRAFT_87063 [Dictyostelium purpureum]|eukprot:XP_003286250.1 hypothetical protein DICPUDRAFT_87063 [Dictyostelium purpureum]
MEKKSDYEILRSYVLDGNDNLVGKAPEGCVRLEVTHSVLSDDLLGTNNFKNFPLDIKIKDFKEKLYRFVGTEPKYMELILKDQSKTNEISKIDNDENLLSFYSPIDGMNIHIIDKDPNSYISELQDTSKIPKPVISEEDYNKRENTVKKYREEQSLMKQQQQEQEENSDPSESIKVGDRCKVLSDDPTNYDERLGKVAFVGTTDFSAGYWVGVELDLPLGKNDGSVKGKRYFTCSPKYGCFAKPKNIQVGDFPEEEI